MIPAILALISGALYTVQRTMMNGKEVPEPSEAPDLTDIRLKRTIKSHRIAHSQAQHEEARRLALWVLEWGARKINLESGYASRRLARVAHGDENLAFSTRRDHMAKITAWLRECGALEQDGNIYRRVRNESGVEMTPLEIMQICDFPYPDWPLPNVLNPYSTTRHDTTDDTTNDDDTTP